LHLFFEAFSSREPVPTSLDPAPRLAMAGIVHLHVVRAF
jgi:hypothetical protein